MVLPSTYVPYLQLHYRQMYIPKMAIQLHRSYAMPCTMHMHANSQHNHAISAASLCTRGCAELALSPSPALMDLSGPVGRVEHRPCE